jgi:hypothetical protein
VKTLKNPTDISEKTIQYFLEKNDMEYIEEHIKLCSKEKSDRIFLEEWKYIKWRMQHERKVFIFR